MLDNWFDSLKEDRDGSIEDVKKVISCVYVDFHVGNVASTVHHSTKLDADARSVPPCNDMPSPQPCLGIQGRLDKLSVLGLNNRKHDMDRRRSPFTLAIVTHHDSSNLHFEVQGVHYLQSATDEGGRQLELDRRWKCLPREKTESVANAGLEAGAVMPELDVSRLSFPKYEPSDVWDRVTQLIEVVAVGNALDLIVLRSWFSVFYYFTGGYMFSVYHKQGERRRYHRPSLATFCGYGERGRSTLLFGAKRRSCVIDPGGYVFLQIFLLVHGVLMVQGIIVKRKETLRLKLICSHGKNMLEKEDDNIEYVADYPEFPHLLYLGAVDMKLQLDISNERVPIVVANACQLSDMSAKQSSCSFDPGGNISLELLFMTLVVVSWFPP